MKISELENCPDWLREADTENANVEIIDGAVHWFSGTWNNGTWEGGTWENGTWLGGTWKSGGWWNGTWNGGTWKEGVWKGGVWYAGTWNRGIWTSGTWCDGIWESGTWCDGTWERVTWCNGIWLAGTWKTGVWESGYQTIRFKYSPLFVSPTQIKIGCKIKTRDEWDAWFASDEEYSTRRETSTFKLIEANYNAFIAYAETLNLIPKK